MAEIWKSYLKHKTKTSRVQTELKKSCWMYEAMYRILWMHNTQGNREAMPTEIRYAKRKKCTLEILLRFWIHHKSQPFDVTVFFWVELAIIESTLQTENCFFKKVTAKYAQLINVWKSIIQILPGGWRVATFIHALLAWFIIFIDIKARPLTDWIVCHSKMHSVPYIKSGTFV